MAKFTLPQSETITVSGVAVDKLIRRGDGDAALLYLYILATRGDRSDRDAAVVLNRTETQIAGASLTLSQLGLILLDETLEKAAEIAAAPTMSEAETVRDPAFRSVADEAQRVVGRPLSSDDMERLVGLYRTLKLPADVIMHLLHHCADATMRARGDNRRPSMRYIEKTAYAWSSGGVDSLESAETYISERESRREELRAVMGALQIKDRELTPTERRYADAWLALGFRADAIAAAYDRTVVKTGKRSWSYMDSIMQSWHTKGVHTVTEINAKDSRANPNPSSAATKSAPKAPTAAETERLRKLMESMGDKKSADFDDEDVL
ncbi:MAG: DnaD domain protein [Oscillospiraceae bacterium]|nr:DnaD domain protein [Oscillospiraceae bacterium]